MITRLAWKNIWRNPTRSLVVITSVCLGIWASVFIAAFFEGTGNQYRNSQLDTYYGHLRIESTSFIEEKTTSSLLPNPDDISALLSTYPQVEHVTSRLVIGGMASSASSSFGVTLYGIDPKSDSLVFGIHRYLFEGINLTSTIKNPILVGKKLADRLNLSLRSKIIMTFQNVDGDITAAAFRIQGIFRSPNSVYDESSVFVLAEDVRRIIHADTGVHQITARLIEPDSAAHLASILSPQFPLDVNVRSWLKTNPDLALMSEMMFTSLSVFMTIIVIALALGILNTMLMVILERRHEMGMLRAIGLGKGKTFFLIMTETLMLSLTGAPIGILLGWITVFFTEKHGIPLEAFSEGLSSYGFATTVYPSLSLAHILFLSVLIILASVLAAIIPAKKALSVNPIEALRR